MQKRTGFYWQKHINGIRHYVEGLDWLLEKAKKDKIRLLEVYQVNPLKKATKLMVYLEGGVLFHAVFKTNQAAREFVILNIFKHANKEIHST